MDARFLRVTRNNALREALGMGQDVIVGVGTGRREGREGREAGALRGGQGGGGRRPEEPVLEERQRRFRGVARRVLRVPHRHHEAVRGVAEPAGDVGEGDAGADEIRAGLMPEISIRSANPIFRE